MYIKPIQTKYGGYFFRSRLEARWAVFFDALKINWEYEKEGYDLGEHGYYLPDFWLPNVTSRGIKSGVFVEIKPAIRLGKKEEQKIKALSYLLPVYCFHGLPGCCHEMWEDSAYEFDGEMWDNCMCFVHCPACGHVKIEFAEGNYMYCPVCKLPAHDKTASLINAYSLARQARFENKR